MSEPNRLLKTIDQCLRSLNYARLAIWAFDFKAAKEETDKCTRLLDGLEEDIERTAKTVAFFAKELKSESRIDTRLKVGESLRKSRTNTEFLIAESLRRLSERYESYLEEVLDRKNTFLQASLHESGFKYVIFPVGTERYEMRAYGRLHLAPYKVEKTIHLMRVLLSMEFPGASVQLLEELHEEKAELLYEAKIRIFVPSIAFADLYLFEDGSLVNQVFAEESTARKIADVVLSALRATHAK